MTARNDQIGFSQRVRLEWFEHTANLVLAGNGKSAVNDALQDELNDKVSVGGDAERGNREKIISILMTTWATVHAGLEPLREDGLELLKRLGRDDRLAVHWGMATAAYPFWSSVATQVGRLLRLQGSAAIAQVQRRVREQYGERETAARACRRVLRSYQDWGVLRATGTLGTYEPATPLTIDDAGVIAWLVEASLRARSNGSEPLKDVINSPSLFPFQIKHVPTDHLSEASDRLVIVRLGLDEQIVALREKPRPKTRRLAKT
jgi:hypothetical protein